MAKKAERKRREEEARRVSGVPVKSEVKAPTAAGANPKAAKRALRAARPAKEPGAEGGAAAD